MLGVNERMDLKLFGREIIFEEFQPICTRYLIVTDGQTDESNLIGLVHSALASRSKNPFAVSPRIQQLLRICVRKPTSPQSAHLCCALTE